MNVEFYAKEVSYTEAIDGEIVQALFKEDDDPNEDPFNRTKLYLLLSTNYEFGSCTADAEWFDGKECGGGVEVTSYKLDSSKLVVQLENGNMFEIVHDADAFVLESIRSYLSNSCARSDA
jgi:hypothetical protein